MIRRINRQSLFVVIPLAAISAFIDWKRLPASILIGGALALANLKGLHWGVTGLLNPEEGKEAKGKLVFFSMFRLLIVFAVLAILIYLRLVNVIGVLVGLTVVFFLLIKEGLKEARRL